MNSALALLGKGCDYVGVAVGLKQSHEVCIDGDGAQSRNQPLLEVLEELKESNEIKSKEQSLEK